MLSSLLDTKKNLKFIETSLSYESWLETIKLIALGKAKAGLTIDGSLSLALLRIRSLPASLTIKGDLDLRQCQRLSKIGNKLKVEGDLLIGGRLRILPNNLPSMVAQLKANKIFPRLPKLIPEYQLKLLTYLASAYTNSLTFLHTLSTKGQTLLQSLPEDLEVKGDLVIRSTPFLKYLPKNFKLGGGLLLHGCKDLETLPDPLNLNGDLVLISCPKLRKLPTNLSAKNLVIIGCGIESLPHKMDIEESIHIESCPKLTTLGDSLMCLETGKLKNLNVYNCPIENLPVYINVIYAIKLIKLPFKILKDSFLQTDSIIIKNCKNLEKIQSTFNLSHTLSFEGCKKLQCFSEPKGMFYTLDLANCESLETLPSKLDFIRHLNLTNCSKLTHLPEDLGFEGSLEISGSAIKTLPQKMSKCSIMWQGHRVPSELIFAPQKLTPGRILSEPNAEIRRLMLETVGINKILLDANAKIIDSDRDAGGDRSLVEVRIRTSPFSEQSCLFLRCLCPSTKREYLLAVSPHLSTCKAAAAWLAGFLLPSDYEPILET